MKRSKVRSSILVGFSAVALVLCKSTSEARLGETAPQNAERYGPPKTDPVTKSYEKTFPLLQGAIIHTYEYQGWKIQAAFLELDSPAVRVEYKKISSPIRDFEVEAILKAEGDWVRAPYDDPHAKTPQEKAGAEFVAGVTGGKMWKRADGAVAWLINGLYVRLELPAARQHEEALKQAKELKARRSVPAF